MVRPKANNSMFSGFAKSRLSRQVQRINKINGTPENAFLFKEITKLELIFPFTRSHQPAIGIRNFLKHDLPTIKFHNDNIDVVVKKVVTEEREQLAQVPIKLVAYQDTNKVEIICDNKPHSEILNSLVESMGGVPVSQEVLESLKI